MMRLTPTTWKGNNINASPYTATFDIESGLDQTAGVEPLFADSISGRPQYQGRVFVERRITLRVKVTGTQSQANYEQLMKWFDPADGEGALVATAEDASTRTLTATVESRRAVDGAEHIYEFVLVAADGRWKKAASQVAWTVASTGSTQAVTNAGTTRVYPRVKVKAAVAKSAANGWTNRRFLHMANRANAPLISPMGAIGYPILLTGAAIDFTGKAVSGAEDIRVFVDGVEWQRTPQGTLVSAVLLWSPIPYVPKRSFQLATNMANNRTTITSLLSRVSLASWPDSGYFIVDSEVCYYESHTEYYFYNVHRGMFNSTVNSHSAGLTERYYMEHVVEYWCNFSGVTTEQAYAYEIDDLLGTLTKTLDYANSDNTNHNFIGYWNRTRRQPRQWVPELIEANRFDAELSLEDKATAIEVRDTPGRFKKNAMTLDCPVPIDDTAAAIEHDITIPTTLALKVYGQDVAGNDILVATYYKSDSGTNVQITPTAELTQLRYEVHNQIVTGGVGTGTDTLVTDSAPYAQTFTLAEDTTIRALFYRHKRASGSNTLSMDLYKVNDDDTGSVDTRTKLMPTHAPGSYDTSYVDETVELATAIKVAAGTYALVWTCSGSTGVNIDSSNGSTYAGGEMRSGGVQTVTLVTDYDAETDNTTKSTTETAVQVGGVTEYRAGIRFPTDSLPDNPDVITVLLRLYIVSASGTAPVWISGFGVAGQYDVQGASASGLFSAANANDYASTSVGTGDVGASKDFTLGGSIASDLSSAKSAVNYFAVGLRSSISGDTDTWTFAGIAHASNPEARLIVSYTESDAAAYTTVVGRDAYFLVLGDAPNAPQADAPEGQGLEVVIDNTELNLVSGTAPQLVNATEETSGVTLLYNARLTNNTTGQYVDIKLPATVGDEIEIDCEAKTVKRTIIGGTNIENGVVGDHVPWCCTWSDEDEWFRLAPGSNTFQWDETGMASNGVVVTLNWDDAWS